MLAPLNLAKSRTPPASALKVRTGHSGRQHRPWGGNQVRSEILYTSAALSLLPVRHPLGAGEPASD